MPSLATSVAIGASGNLDLTDFGTARGRAGYVIGNFLPYGFIGMAVGRASYSLATRSVLQQNTAANPIFPCVDNWGYTVGAGLDWALTPNIFARGEFEFVQFAPITNIAVSVASGRVGAGFKF